MHIHRPALDFHLKAPHLVKQLTAREQLVDVAGKEVQHFQLLRRHLQLLALVEHFVAAQADRQSGEGQRIVVGFFLFLGLPHRPAKHCLDARRHLLAVKRLGDVVVRAQLQPQHLIERLVPRCDHNNRDVRGLPHGFEHLPAVHAGHHHVQQHQIRRHFAELGHRVIPAPNRLHLIPRLLQIQLLQFRNIRVIIDHENIRLFFHKTPPQGASPLEPTKGTSSLWTPIRAIELVTSSCNFRVLSRGFAPDEKILA